MSENYRALTRTYRPQSFDDIVSQEHVSSTLKNAIKQNRLSHAYMFCGPRGVGKTTMARVLARTINSIETEVDGEALNQTLNVIEIDAASNNKVDDIHQLREKVRIPPQNGRYKVFIIDEVHMLSKAAFNALLKTLEEPPEHAIFIFATTEPHKVLPTILSRVQRFDFRRISVDEIVERLKKISDREQIRIDEESLHVIAKKADGALRDALGLMDQAIAFCGNDIEYSELLKALNVVGSEQLFRFTDAIQKQSADEGLNLVDELLQAGADIQEFLGELTEHLRNLYVAVKSERLYLVDATKDTKERYRETAKHFTEEDLLRMMHLVSQAQITIRDVQQPRVHFEILLLKLVHMSRTPALNELMTELNVLKKKSRKPVAGNAEEKTSGKPTEKPGEEKKETRPNPEDAGERDTQGKEETEEKPPDPPSQEKEPEAEQSKPEEKDPEPEEDELLVKPTLGYAKGISSQNGSSGNEKAAEEKPVQEQEKRPVTSVDDIEAVWQDFLTLLKEEAPRMLYFQIQRVELKELKGRELIVSADNEFSTNLFEENQQLLSSLMKRTAGAYVRMRCVVERREKKKESLSPFERFKEIQKKDPHLKSVVELFGAELEY